MAFLTQKSAQLAQKVHEPRKKRRVISCPSSVSTAVVLMAARAAGVDALDVVFSDINDLEGLREDTVLTKNLGFDGKTVIHPRQIDIVNSFFTPTQKEIEYALRVLAVVEEGKRLKKGAVTLDGSMIDKPMELRALTTLEQARAAGIRIGGEEG